MKKILLFIAALILCGTMQAQEYHWTYDYHQWDNSCPMIAVAYLNGEVLASGNYEVAAFVGDEVRGTEYLLEVDPTYYPGVYFVWYGISFSNNNETVTFKLYDHATNTEYADCSSTLLTNQDGYGEEDDPFIIEFTAEEPVSYGPEYPWVVSGGFEDYMYLEAQIQINGVPVSNTNWEVGAFCGDECRGLGDADNWWVSPVDESNILEIVVGGATGDVINFYLYDVTNQEVFHGVCNETLDWVDDDIGDMFDPYVINFVTEQQFYKDIEAYDPDPEVRNHYYLIASPIGEVDPEEVTNMLSNKYDLYAFDQNDELEWNNYESNTFNLVSGKGYLYANSGNVRLTFTGTAYNGDGKVTLDKVANVNWEGWNLVGNPFADTAYIGGKAFYRMNEDGTDVEAATKAAIAPMEGIFVIANTNGETLTFSTEEPSTPGKNLVLSIVRNRGNVIDRGIVRFDNGDVLPKFQINPNNTKVYFPVDNKDYAVVNADESGEMPVNFKAAQNGTYTINVSMQEIALRYLHLIDNMMGADVDLLKTPSYTFEADVADYASRFKLVFVAADSVDSDTFAFFNNGNWIVNNDGEAVLQLIDVNGRVLRSEQISGSVNKHYDYAPGIYMMRLINGNDVKTQKIIIK